MQQSAANILLQNFPSTVGQQQHNVTTAQNQLSALLASGSCSSAPSASGGASNHVVLSQLLQVQDSTFSFLRHFNFYVSMVSVE
jgi:hypothetical protein